MMFVGNLPWGRKGGRPRGCTILGPRRLRPRSDVMVFPVTPAKLRKGYVSAFTTLRGLHRHRSLDADMIPGN